MTDDSSFLYSTESIIFILVILFLIFCSGFLKAIKHYFRSKPDFRPPIHIPPAPPLARDVLVTHISLPQSRQESIMASNINISDEEISPPPYSAAIIPPPSYDEATKQYSRAKY